MLALALLAFACGDVIAPPPRPKKPNAPQAQAPAPPAAPAVDDGLQLIDAQGLLKHVRDSGRKATLVNVWASWCGSCKRELPMLIGLQKALDQEGVGLVLVTLDKPADRPTAVSLLKAVDPLARSFIYLGALAPFKRAINPMWKGALPATGLYDKNAELLWFWPGPVLEHEITPIVSQYLEGRPLEGPILVEPDPPPQ